MVLDALDLHDGLGGFDVIVFFGGRCRSRRREEQPERIAATEEEKQHQKSRSSLHREPMIEGVVQIRQCTSDFDSSVRARTDESKFAERSQSAAEPRPEPPFIPAADSFCGENGTVPR